VFIQRKQIKIEACVFDMSEDKHHPVWKILSNLIMLGGILFLSASDFDKTEYQTLLLFLGGSSAIERFVQ
jgi:hypothetical protein